jgi:glycosyltransferase 2 family protein
MKIKYFNLLKIGLGLFIIFILVYSIGLKKILNTFSDINLFPFAGVVLFYFLGFLTGALNLEILLRCINKNFGYLKLLKYYLLSWSVSLFLPGKVGEFSIIYFMKNENIELGEAVVISLMDKIITILSLLSFAVFGFFVFFSIYDAIKIIFIILIGFVLLLLFIMTNFGRSIIKKIFLRKYASKFKGFSKTWFFYFRKRKKLLLLNYIITLIKWSFAFWMMYFLFLVFRWNVSFVNILLVVSTVRLISLVPITISGLGIREMSAIYLFGKLANPIPVNITASVYLIVLLINYLTAFVIVVFLKKKDILFKITDKVSNS